MLGGSPAKDKHSHQEGSRNTTVTSCYRNRDKLRPDGAFDSDADYIYLFTHLYIEASAHSASVHDGVTSLIRSSWIIRGFL